jgi:tetratricopeptide (TPR) repeat protein
MTNKFFGLTAILLLSFAAFAQTKGSTTPAPNPSTGPESTSDVGKFANWDRLAQQARPGDYLLGNVKVDGPPVWEPIAVTVTCDGKTRFTTRTDVKGLFRIISVDTTGRVPVAASSQRSMTSQYAGCEVRAILPGFQSSMLVIINGNATDDPNIGTLTLKREEGARGTAVSATSDSAPKDAAKLFEKARNELLDGKPDRAQHDLEKAVQIYPQYAEAWYQLGRLQEPSNQQAAQNSFQKAVAADPNLVPAYEHLASKAALERKYPELLEYTGHALQLDPRGTPSLWYYDAMANHNLGHDDVAKASAEKGLRMDPLHTEPNTEQLLAVILAAQRDYAGALEHLRNCLTYYTPGPNADVVRQQIAQLEHVLAASK